MTNIFKTAYEEWLRASDFRNRRHRFKNFTYGKQWDDVVADPLTGEAVSEYDAAVSETGRSPLTNNLIRRLVKTIVGRYRSERARLKRDDAVNRLNRLDELDCRLLEEFLISGCAVQRIARECRRRGLIETFVDNVNPDDFFINTTRDTRGWDIRLIGMLHDMSLAEVLMKFAHGNRSRGAELRKIYDYEHNRNLLYPSGISLGSEAHAADFFMSPTGRCRAVEVWTLESTEVVRCHDRRRGLYYETSPDKAPADCNADIDTRWEIVTRWHCRWFAPDGTLLDHYLSAEPDGSHPFVVKLYPLTDGEIHSFVEDIIGQQKQINRLITIIDHIMSTSAKGLLLFPTKAKPESVTWEEISRRWGRCGGVIPYNATAGTQQPTQVTSAGLDAGASHLLEIQMKMLNDVSGVGDMLLGNDMPANVGAERYKSQLENAANALTDIIASFNDLVEMRDEKLLI